MSNALPKIDYSLSELNRLIDVIRERVSIAVLYAGNPEEPGMVLQRTSNSRSWKSYREVAEQLVESLKSSGFKKVEVFAESAALPSILAKKQHQLLWLNSGGVQGRGSVAHAPSLLESLGLPYVGHTPIQAALLDDKILMKQWLNGVGLPTAPFIIRGAGHRQHVTITDPDYARVFGVRFRGPFLVKPALGRGSVLIEVVDDIKDLDAAIKKIGVVTNDRVIVEQFLVGQEFCVWASRGCQVENGIVVSQSSVTPFGQSERLYLDRDRLFRKNEAGNSIPDLCRPLSEKDKRLRDDLSYLGRALFSYLSLFVPVRVDARLGEDGLLQILEVNPKPDLKRPSFDQSGLLSCALNDLNISFDDFIVKVLADWLDFHLRFSPSTLAILQPAFDSSLPTPQSGILRSGASRSRKVTNPPSTSGFH